MRFINFTILLMLFIAPFSAQGGKQNQQVKVADPYVDMRTGPGRGYPIYHIAQRGAELELLSRRTDWVQVRLTDGKEGWVDLRQMRRTLQEDGSNTKFNDGSMVDYADHRWEVGVMGGDFGGANVLTGYGSFAFTPNIAVELALSQLLGNVSNGHIIAVNLSHTFFPRSRISPFISLGVGELVVKPQTTLVQAENQRYDTAIAGLGVKAYLTRRLMFRAEYKDYFVFTNRDENEDVREWKLGFSVFY